MTVPPRAAHVIRITNPNNPNMWVDVLRLDKAYLNYRNTSLEKALTQQIEHVLNWGDGWPKDDNVGPPTTRKTKALTVANPSDATQTIDIDINEQIRLITMGQGTVHVFKNGETNDARERGVDVVTVYHTDVSSLDMSQPVDWADYEPVLASGAQDTSQKIVVELPKSLKSLLRGDPSGQTALGRNYVFQNKTVFDAVTQGQQGSY